MLVKVPQPTSLTKRVKDQYVIIYAAAESTRRGNVTLSNNPIRQNIYVR